MVRFIYFVFFPISSLNNKKNDKIRINLIDFIEILENRCANTNIH